MSNSLTRLTLALLAASFCAAAAAAQDAPAAPEWVAVSPAGEQFAARMPKEPWRFPQDVRARELTASGRRYTATGAGGARYDIWSLNDAGNVSARLHEAGYGGWGSAGKLRYLDLVAEAAWELLVRPEVERLDAERARTGRAVEFLPRMSFEREFELGGHAAREYTLRLEKEGGPVYVCADGGRLYVVAALAPELSAADSKRFVESFALGAKTPAPPKPQAEPAPVPQGTGVAAPADPSAPVDYARPFRSNEVTKRATITFRPEPGFTEEARRFVVVGTVRLRAILSSTGEVVNISVVKHLPHGLTEKSLDAAKRIRFNPAQKDGRAVAQYVVLEYHYNIY